MPEVFTYFWKSPLSQWSLSRFTVNQINYNCAEQYMMAEKARLFQDEETAKLIMKARSPRAMQLLGREVSNFDQKVWDDKKRGIVYRGNLAKFSQLQGFKDLLFSTVGTTLVECNPKDSVWGIGLSKKDPKALSRPTWEGENLLGEILTELRDELILKAMRANQK